MFTITETISKITKSTSMLALNASKDIVENIQTISAITEEISAHANETFNACDENIRMVDSVSHIVEKLNDGAQKLQNV